jgi:ABC-type transporter Mla MlaB component
MARPRESGEEDAPLSSAADRLREPWFSAEAHDLDTETPVVVVDGEVDIATAPELAEAVAEALEKLPRTLVFDLADVTFLDSSGIKHSCTLGEVFRRDVR